MWLIPLQQEMMGNAGVTIAPLLGGARELQSFWETPRLPLKGSFKGDMGPHDIWARYEAIYREHSGQRNSYGPLPSSQGSKPWAPILKMVYPGV